LSTYYSKNYAVPVLREALRAWQKQDRFYEFRGRIVDAIEGHSEGDHVRCRFDNDRQVKLFEAAMDG
jgi:hypothetical protein